MAFDWIDGMAVVGALALAAAAFTLEGIVVAAAFGGFALSLAVWRLYGGRPWEALGWLAWSARPARSSSISAAARFSRCFSASASSASSS